MKTAEFDNPYLLQSVLAGDVVSIPTETVYGVGVRWDDSNAYDKLCKAKGRRPDKAIACMCSDTFDLDQYFDISPRARKVMKKFLPGPLTCLVKARENAPYQSHLGTYIAGIRIPGKADLLSFLDKLGMPMQVTSANMSGQPALTDYESVVSTFTHDEISVIVKGECQSKIATTVVDLTKDRPVVIREGQITLKQIEEVFFE